MEKTRTQTLEVGGTEQETAGRMSFHVTRKYNLGNYESVDVNVGMTVNVDRDESIDEKWSELKETVMMFLREATSAVMDSD